MWFEQSWTEREPEAMQRMGNIFGSHIILLQNFTTSDIFIPFFSFIALLFHISFDIYFVPTCLFFSYCLIINEWIAMFVSFSLSFFSMWIWFNFLWFAFFFLRIFCLVFFILPLLHMGECVFLPFFWFYLLRIFFFNFWISLNWMAKMCTIFKRKTKTKFENRYQ